MSVQPIDYHAVLGLGQDASPGEIKSAYRRLAKQHADGQRGHGDEAEQRLRDINIARTSLLKQAVPVAASRRSPQRAASPFSARSRLQPGRAKHAAQTSPRAAGRFFGRLKVEGLDRANRVTQSSQAAAGSSAKGAIRSSLRKGPTFVPGFCC